MQAKPKHEESTDNGNLNLWECQNMRNLSQELPTHAKPKPLERQNKSNLSQGRAKTIETSQGSQVYGRGGLEATPYKFVKFRYQAPFAPLAGVRFRPMRFP